MGHLIDLYWSFRSPYSYLATPRLVDIEQEYDLTVNVRPVYPLAVRSGEFFSRVRWSSTCRHSRQRRTSLTSVG